MILKRIASPLHRRNTLQRGSRLSGRIAELIVARRPSRKPLDEPLQRDQFERELQKAKELALEISWPLRRSEERLDSSLRRIDATLQELAAQREQIRRLEHDLGIER
jgi:hypothetical protein